MPKGNRSPWTKDVVTHVEPQNLFEEEARSTSTSRPSQSEPGRDKTKPMKDNRMLVETTQGKKVLSSDARLHSEKIKLRKQQNVDVEDENPDEVVDPELVLLEKERRILLEKVRRKQEIARLQRELDGSLDE
ncbi:hypothetical protein POM88_025099 [Heracleum sosnowskyi]|uniref:Uncharacterized protein n=1 Tax=Heracleum sosnowskyi TaxID=360622 RepID=A0AAD8I6E3_9APIA|nr:hypothetical protein POM88_025099 [Heracleum sosnowskyi]